MTDVIAAPPRTPVEPPPVVAGSRRVPLALSFGLLILLWWTLVAVFGQHLAPFDPVAQDPATKFASPSGEHWLGTDQFGRDVFSRMLAGARSVLSVAPLATVLSLIVGTIVGLIAGASGRWVDEAVMRVLDTLTVFPAIVASILFVALLGQSTPVLVLVIGFSFVPIVARSVRAATLVERDKPYVEAARLRGEPTWSLLFREILPNITTTVLVEAVSRLGDAVFAAATLSFLGLGAAPGSPDWGASVADNRAWLQIAPWTVLTPALAIASLVIGVALVTDELRARTERS
ncbi:ABC transporter permease [Cryptosporangium aurantiacum]|uniref:Peptide/nickel transport system permease protein n=1 Tax=Cryptosporangium aurantiacum TaxID=134849 RepID=A0A1M7KAJ7_9ACTN|nr:ABC transporter permease [Cryptosporangium aurantiacum]SHM62254.1 peptide/nickel transport system permease protein [Cryptosporangium aurantiacum]